MQTRQEPLISLIVESFSFEKIQNELKSFGLNPKDWKAVKTFRQNPSQLTLVHRDDRDLRLMVKVESRSSVRNDRSIQAIELLVV